MFEIVINNEWSTSSVLKRISEIVIGNHLLDQDYHYDDTAQHWALCHNNWWVSKEQLDNKTSKYTVRYRYTTPEKQQAINGLALFLKTFVFQ